MTQPVIVFGMLDGMVRHLLTPDQIARLEACGRIPDPAPISSWDDERADALLAEAEILVGHWGCPTLTAEVLDRAPALRLFAYGAGTVKWQVTDAVFARGVSPAGPWKHGPGRVGWPVACGHVVCNAGDVAVGDSDGVAIVAAADLTSVLERARTRDDLEVAKRATIKRPSTSR